MSRFHFLIEYEPTKTYFHICDPLIALEEVVGGTKFDSGIAAATSIKDESKQGKTPILKLFIGGHNHDFSNGNTIGTDGNGGGPRFEASHLFDVADEKNNKKNSYASAVREIGPPRCWFTRNAKIYGFACESYGSWQPDWTSKVARKGSIVYGLEESPDSELGPKGAVLITQKDGEKLRYRSITHLMSSRHWIGEGGTQ